jgi:hypothetical protein
MNNKTTYNNKKERLTGFEKHSVIIFRLIGFLFFILAITYFFDNQDGSIQKVIKIISNKNNAIKQKNSAFSWEVFSELLTYYIPIIIGMIFCIYIFQKKKLISYYVNIALIIAAIFFNSKIYITSWMTNYQFCYSNYFITSVFLIIPTSLFLINYYKHKRTFLLTLTSIYFYIFLFQLLIIRFSYTYLYVFVSILIYNGIVGIITRKEKSFLNNWIDFFSANFFLIIYVIRQFYYNQKEDSLGLFFTTSIAFLILFSAIGFFKKHNDNKNSTSLFFILNNVFFIVLNIVTLFIFSYKEYFFIPLLLTIVINGILILATIKYNYCKEKTESFEFIFIFLISSFTASLLYNHSFELFLATTSILLSFYFRYNNKNYFILSVVIPAIFLITNLIFAIISIENNLTNFNTDLFKKELIGYCISIGAIFIVKKIVNKDLKTNIPIKKRIYYDFLEGLFILNILFFLAWFLYRIELLTTGNIRHYLTTLKTSFLIVGIYLTYNNNFISIKVNKLIKYTLLVFCIIIPIIEFSQFPYANTDYLNNIDFFRYESIFHYPSLIAYIILLWRLINFSKKSNPEKKKLQLFIESITGITLLIIICKEYDWITIMLSNKMNPEILINKINYNTIFPYSYIIVTSSMILFLIGVINKNKILRVFSLLINFFIIAKILYFDFKVLSKGEKISLMIGIGTLFIIISWLYNKIKAKRKKRKIRLE